MKKSAIFGVKNLGHYDVGSLLTFGGLALSLVGGIVALAGHVLEDSSLSAHQLRFPDEEAVDAIELLGLSIFSSFLILFEQFQLTCRFWFYDR